MACQYQREDKTYCTEVSTHSTGGKDYCYAHLLVRMATVGRPPCTYFNNVMSFCLRKVYDGRNPERALCEFHAKRGRWYERV